MTRLNTLTFLYSYTYGQSGEIGVAIESRVIATTLRDNSNHRHFPQMNCVRVGTNCQICHLIVSYLQADWIHFTPQNPKRHVHHKSTSSYSSTLELKSSASSSFFAVFLPNASFWSIFSFSF
jgi:hypothetical protein